MNEFTVNIVDKEKNVIAKDVSQGVLNLSLQGDELHIETLGNNTVVELFDGDEITLKFKRNKSTLPV